jgi:hypothetical protein
MVLVLTLGVKTAKKKYLAFPPFRLASFLIISFGSFCAIFVASSCLVSPLGQTAVNYGFKVDV